MFEHFSIKIKSMRIESQSLTSKVRKTTRVLVENGFFVKWHGDMPRNEQHSNIQNKYEYEEMKFQHFVLLLFCSFMVVDYSHRFHSFSASKWFSAR